MYKYHNKLLPLPFKNFYAENRDFHSYQTRSAAKLRIPLTRTKIASSFIKKTGVSIWSEFSPHISHEKRIGTFKKDLVSLLIAPYLS
jgi:hypothetical protein